LASIRRNLKFRLQILHSHFARGFADHGADVVIVPLGIVAVVELMPPRAASSRSQHG
jgi:hypothetical protein